jgi:hypothetical protein
MDKLYKYGVCGIPHGLIKSFLTNRTQNVKLAHIENNQMKEYLSSSLLVRYGVPWGLVLGPLYFMLYINDVVYKNDDKQLLTQDLLLSFILVM